MKQWITGIFLAAALLVQGNAARALRIQDVARLKGDVPNQLVGMGMVFGLNGTGDGGDFAPAMRPLAQMLTKFNNPVALGTELKNANNVALVVLTVTVPAAGARIGDRLDVRVDGIAAKSLVGGHLFFTPLQAPRLQPVFALAEGTLVIEDDKVLTNGIIKNGAVIQQDIVNSSIRNDGTFDLILNPAAASYATANALADQINEDVSPQTDGHPMANAVDATTVTVQIPETEAARSTAFIARILALQVPTLPGPAKVLINSKTGTIVFTGAVELTPTMISHNGLTITVSDDAAATQPADAPRPKTANLKDLMDAFNLMHIGAKDRITIIRQLYDSGALHCQLEGQ